MLNAKFVKLAAALAWCSLAVAKATPANAKAWTWQTGDYAACSWHSSPEWYELECENGVIVTSYYQNIRFVNTSCNQGSGCGDDGYTYTEFVYSSGRKTADYLALCSPYQYGNYLYDLGSCAC